MLKILSVEIKVPAEFGVFQKSRNEEYDISRDRVSSLILGRSDLSTSRRPRLLPLCFHILYLIIGKRIRSNTLSRLVSPVFMNNLG